jgi:hypothetical protein
MKSHRTIDLRKLLRSGGFVGVRDLVFTLQNSAMGRLAASWLDLAEVAAADGQVKALQPSVVVQFESPQGWRVRANGGMIGT